jgi:hypothetical protein
MFKSIITFVLLFISFSVFAQDTIPARKIKVATLNLRTGKPLTAPHWKKVKSGKIIKLNKNDYLVDNVIYHPGDDKPLKIKK